MVAKQDLALADYVRILRRRWIVIVVLAIVGCASAIMVARALPKKFTSQMTVLVEPPTVSNHIVDPLFTDDLSQRLAAMQEQILSRSRLEPVIRQLNIYPQELDRVPMEILVGRLRTAIVVAPMESMAQVRTQRLPGFTVSVTFADAKLAQQICSTVTSLFLKENLALRQGQAVQTTEFVGSRLDEAKAKLDEQDAKLAAFKRLHFGSLPEQEQTNLNLLMNFTSQFEATTQALNRAEQDKSFAESQLAQQIATWQASQTGQNPETLEQQLSALQSQLAVLNSKYTDDHPDVIKAKNDIATLEQKIAESEEQRKSAGPDKAVKSSGEPAQIQQMRVQIHQYDQVIKERTEQQEQIQQQIRTYQARVQSSPAVEQEYKELTRDYQTAQEFYDDLMKKRDQSEMATALEQRQQSEQFRILDAANLPNRPSFPDPLLFAGGGFGGGLALGLGLALFIEMQDSSMRNERDVEHALRLPILAMLPVVTSKTKKFQRPNSILNSANVKTGTRG